MDLYNCNLLPLSERNNVRRIQDKALSGEKLSILDYGLLGRDVIVKKINDYELKPDHCYRAVNKHTLDEYYNKGYIFSDREDDEYQEYIEDGKTYNNNKGIDWYLGGASLRYGDIIIECPAYTKYFTLAIDNGCGMAIDPFVRHIKSSGGKNPIPVSLITNVFVLNEKIDEQIEVKR